jgi:hypothetical protein
MLKCMRLVSFMFLLFLILVPSVEAVQISAPYDTVGVGDTFTIPISITGATDLTAWQFELAFNPAILQANFVEEGTFLSSFGPTLYLAGFIDNNAGLISGVADFYIDLPPNPSGDGVLANIDFVAIAPITPGVSPLTFSNVFLNWLDSGFDISNGQITVTGTTSVPEPTTLVLLVIGLVPLGLQRLVINRKRFTSTRNH